jgi:glycosyltransferase involved in cell wall biosynthesis
MKKRILIFGARENNSGGINKWCSQLHDDRKYEIIYIYENTVNNRFHFLRTLFNVFIKSLIGIFTTKTDIVIFHKEIYALPYLFASIFRKSVFLVIHGFHHDNKKYNLFLRYVTSRVCYLVIRFKPLSVILVSKYDQLQLKFGIRSKVRLIENAIDCHSIELKRKIHNNKMVYMGRVSREKGILDFLSKNELNGFELHIYGPMELSVDDELKFKSILQKKGNFIYHGEVEYCEVRSILCGFEFFLNPSSRESMPFSVLEAVCCECKLILSDIMAHRALGFDCYYMKECLIETDIHCRDWDLNGNIQKLLNNHDVEIWKQRMEEVLLNS